MGIVYHVAYMYFCEHILCLSGVARGIRGIGSPAAAAGGVGGAGHARVAHQVHLCLHDDRYAKHYRTAPMCHDMFVIY